MIIIEMTGLWGQGLCPWELQISLNLKSNRNLQDKKHTSDSINHFFSLSIGYFYRRDSKFPMQTCCLVLCWIILVKWLTQQYLKYRVCIYWELLKEAALTLQVSGISREFVSIFNFLKISSSTSNFPTWKHYWLY